MPTKRLTDKFIKYVEIPTQGIIDYYDLDRGGFALRVSYGGNKSWVIKYRAPDDKDDHGQPKQRRMTIGKYPRLSLSDARKKAKDILDRVDDGDDPQKEKMDAKEAAKDGALKIGPDPVTVQEGIARYVSDHVKIKCKPQRKADGTPYFEIERMFEKYVIPSIGTMRLDEIKRKDVMAMHRRIEKAHGLSQADSAAGYARTVFNWLHDRELAEGVPIIRFKATKVKRTRTLEHPEIQALWTDLNTEHQANKLSIFASVTKLLLLTGQRRQEVAGMLWSELDIDHQVWSLPPERTKNGLPHMVPLSKAALEIIEAQEPVPGCDYVFTSTGKTQFTGYSRSKERLDKRLKFSDPWVLHDLRRTAVTGMNDIGIPPHVVEAVVNHISGSAKGGVAGVYNKAQYWHERVDAMTRWAFHLAAIVDGSAESNVIPFQAGGK